jgi:3-oxoacyl-[acyl-carrier protein] reductase
MTVKERVAFVTGASQGIGRACALALAEGGARVVIGARNREKLAQVEQEIRAQGGETLAVPLDVASEEAIQSAFRQALERFERIDILVNNAGIVRDQLALRMKRADWDAVLNTNLTGAYLCIQQVLPGMVKRRYGRIVNITSVMAQIGSPGQANYASSKAGLIGLTKSLAIELASRNITVNAVAPGFMETAMTEPLPEARKQEYLARIPLGRMGTDRDVAYAVRFLVAEEAGYITGHVLDVNGGLYLA